MPLFEFSCRRCGRRFETLVTGTRTPECPDCRSVDLEKLVSSFGTHTASARPAGASSPFT